MVNNVARPPFAEDNRSKTYRYGQEFFEKSDDGSVVSPSYYHQLESATELARKHHGTVSEEELRKLKTLIVHECERSKAWASLWDKKDDPQRALDEWFTVSREALLSFSSRLADLNLLDQRHGFDLRNTFYRSAQFAMSPSEPSAVWLPDVNHEENGFSIPSGGPIARQVELHMLGRLFLGQFPEWIVALESEIQDLHSGFELGRRVGPMCIDPHLSRNQVLQRDGARLATVGLIARLQAIFRRITSKTGAFIPTNMDSICGDLPDYGCPCWPVISDFVTAAFPDSPDRRALEQRWSAFRRGRHIQIQNWPSAVQRHVSMPDNSSASLT